MYTHQNSALLAGSNVLTYESLWDNLQSCIASDQISWQSFMKIAAQTEHCILHSDDTTRMCLCMSEISVYSKFQSFENLYTIQPAIWNTHTRRHNVSYFIVLSYLHEHYRVLAPCNTQGGGAHMQYNSKLGLHAQHRCTVIPASLCRVQDI